MSTYLCLHGFTGTPAAWDFLRALLSPSSEIFCPPILGHAGGPSKGASFEAEIDRLAGLVRERGGRDVHLAGYSQGGRLAIGLLVRHRGLFARATLIGASPGLPTAEERAARRVADERLARRLETEGLEPFLEFWQSLPLFASQKRLPKDVLEAQRAERRRHDAKGLAEALRVLGTGTMPSYWRRLEEIDVPVHLMVGKLDAKFCQLAEEIAERLPRSSVEVVPGAGHNLLLEAPGRVARALARSRRLGDL